MFKLKNQIKMNNYLENLAINPVNVAFWTVIFLIALVLAIVNYQKSKTSQKEFHSDYVPLSIIGFAMAAFIACCLIFCPVGDINPTYLMDKYSFLGFFAYIAYWLAYGMIVVVICGVGGTTLYFGETLSDN